MSPVQLLTISSYNAEKFLSQGGGTFFEWERYDLWLVYVSIIVLAAALLAAVIAPTDPVLTSEVQTGSPDEEDISPTRLALTSEAGVKMGWHFLSLIWPSRWPHEAPGI